MSDDETDWKTNIDKVYKTWKYNDVHKNIKEYFSKLKNSDKLNCVYKQDSSPLITDLSELKVKVEDKRKNNEKVFVKDEMKQVTFLGAKIDVGDEDEDEVDEFCKETIFAGFWKTIKKLCDSLYLALKSVGEVIKKVVKKLVDFLEAGMQSVVIILGEAVARIVAWANPLPDYEIHDVLGVACITDLPFQNVAMTINNKPRITFFPKTVDELSQVVIWSQEQGLRCRASGMRHSWSDLFGEDGGVLVSLLPLEVTDHLTFGRMEGGGLEHHLQEWQSQLRGIQLMEEVSPWQAAVRVGAAFTNHEMVAWSIKSGWTLPLDIIAAMISYGGSNATICHGAGINNKTLSDLVLKIEFVNAKGNLQEVSDPYQLKAVSGAFGMLGIVTAITFQMDRMSYAKFHPRKTMMADSIPRPGTEINDPAFQRMVELCRDCYYSEFFWFPNHGVEEGYWENCWNNDGEEEAAVDLNEQLDDQYQVASTFLFEVMTKVIQPLITVTREEHYDETSSLKEWLRYLFTKMISLSAINVLPAPEAEIVTSLVEALHFRTGFHYIFVREMEMEIPIPSLADGMPDWSIVSRAWWDAVDLIEESAAAKVFACDMALEMRIMGGSDVLMAPQFGNQHGTLAIEPVSTRLVHPGVWEDFKEQLARVWMSYTDYDGTPLKCRVHWAKESPRGITWNGEEIGTVQHLHGIYADNMAEFFDILNELTEGVTVEDLYNQFSNQYLDEVFEPQWTRFGVKRREEPVVVDGGNDQEMIDEYNNTANNKTSSCCLIV